MSVFIARYDDELYKLSENALQEHYDVQPLPDDLHLIEYLRQNTAELILITLSATDLRGFRTLDIIKRIPEMQEKPVIFLAKQYSSEWESRALSLGADDFMTLPISPQLLLHRVNNYMRMASLRNQRPLMEEYEDEISVIFAELVECRDLVTGDHLKNTTRYFTILLQEALESGQYKELIAPEDISDVIRSATLHDIGKIGILDGILRKESTLDYNEYEQMKTHTTLGKQAFEKIIRETGGSKWLYFAKDMAYCHHERWDGTGYPNGLKGEEIPIYARMLTIADVYDALTSKRAYKKAYSHKKAMDIILEGKGNYFDPSLVDIFVNANKRFEEMLLKNTQHLRR